MTDDPYQPPDAPILNDEALEGTGRFDVRTCVSDSWDATWSSFPVWLGVWAVGSLVMVVSGALLFGIFLVWPILFFGFTRFYLNAMDSRESFGDLFSGFASYGTVLVDGLILAVLLFVISLVGQSVQVVASLTGNTVFEIVGVVVNLVWSYGIMIRLYFAPFFWVDRGLSPVESIQASWETTRGQWLRLVGLAIMTGVLITVGFLALLVGVIPAINMGYLMWAGAYRQTVGRPAPA